MTVALYCRVSTDEQAEHGFSLEAQKDRLIAYCQSQGWKDYEVYTDDGYSGTTLDRPALNKLLRHIEKGRIECVVVYRLDRLSRRQRHCLHLLEEVFEAQDIAFKSATEPFDTSTPLGKAMIGILAVFAQLERDTIIQRVTEGHYKRARKGLWGGGPQPFGYKWNEERGQLEIVPGEAKVVREIFRRLIDGHSLQSIGDWAQARTGPGKWWDHNVIKNIIERDTYLGYIQYGEVKVEGTHEAIIDAETAARAREELKQRNAKNKRPIGSYLLSGLIKCECGEPMLHHQIKKPNKMVHYYVCNRKQIGKRYHKPGTCNAKHIRMEFLDEEITQYIRRMATDPSVLVLDNNSDKEEVRSAVQNLEGELASVERKLKRWYDIYEDDESGFDMKEVKRRVTELEAEKARVELLLEELHDQLQVPDPTPVIDAFNAINDAWDDMNLNQRQRILRAAIRKITVHEDGKNFDIEWNV